MELAKCLQLVVPASMTADDRSAWLVAAADALEDIRADEVKAVSAEIRRTVTRPAQIVPEIAKRVAELRQRRNRSARPLPPSLPEPAPRPTPLPLTATEIANLSPDLIKMGLKCGALKYLGTQLVDVEA